MLIFEQLEAALATKGWRYDPAQAAFVGGDIRIDWGDVLELVPDMTLGELARYTDQKDELSKRADKNS